MGKHVNLYPFYFRFKHKIPVYIVDVVKGVPIISECLITYVNGKNRHIGLRFRVNYIDYDDPNLFLTYESARRYANTLNP